MSVEGELGNKLRKWTNMAHTDCTGKPAEKENILQRKREYSTEKKRIFYREKENILQRKRECSTEKK